MARALLIVDVQPTFCEGGALGIEGGNAVAERIAEYAEDNLDTYDLIVTTQDWHIDPGEHFSDNPDFVDTWPPHGVAGTPDAELHKALAGVPLDYSVKKGEYQAAYSGFEGACPDGTTLAEVLVNEEINEVDVVGLALSHCVKETAIDAIHMDSIDSVRVFLDLSEPTSKELGDKAKEEMAAEDIELTYALSETN